jgi:serine/threonine protein kinase
MEKTTSTSEMEEPRVLLAAEDLLGYVIDGRYRLDEVLGEGGMGVVYRSHEPRLQRDIAVKLLKPSEVQGTKRIERFQRELSIIAGLSHPNIVRVYDSGMDEDVALHFIAMELVEGISLDRVLRHHRVAPNLALEIAYQICGALTEPHAHGIIHRDIKPENTLVTVMSDASLQVKLLDFGIARTHATESERLTTTGVVMGTPRYMAPESVQGGEIDARTDLYSVGVILYEMLAGRTPFSGVTPVATMIEHVTKAAPRLDEAVQGFEYPRIVELVRLLLEKDPRKRLDSARSVREMIDSIRDEHGFKRLRLSPGNTKAALQPYLSEIEPTQTDPDELFGTYESTLPLGHDETPTESAMFPVPAGVARKHFKEMGWSKQLPDVSTEIAVAQSDRRSATYEMTVASSSNPLVWVLLVVLIGAAVLGVVFWQQRSAPVVNLGSKSTLPAQVEAEKPDEKVVEEPAPIEPQKVEEPEVVEEVEVPKEAEKAEKTEPKPEAKPKKTEPAVEEKAEEKTKEKDAVKEGLEWLKQ